MSSIHGFDFEYIQTSPWPIVRRPIMIAEIGINHNGSLDIARQLIDMASEVGCDFVKFQKRTIDIVYTPEQLAQPRESPWGSTQREQKEGLEFNEQEYDEIDAYCKSKGIGWFASAWDIESLKFLRKYDLPYNKVASAMLTHLPFIEEVAREGKPTFVSTGMSTYEQIDAAVAVFARHDCPIVLMHSVSEYPAPVERLNLLAINSLWQRYGLPVGYSGHETVMANVVNFATLLGAVALERHITLDRAMYGTDQSASLERTGLKKMVTYVNFLPLILGDGVKRVTEEEAKVAKKLRYWE
ncbi:MAG TPA: N-acetylneuraminate synthase [Rhodocyclaceae bacterium]|nr:N-acetylneuraminate synthase [Rhodocyclaceae bacterium]